MSTTIWLVMNSQMPSLATMMNLSLATSSVQGEAHTRSGLGEEAHRLADAVTDGASEGAAWAHLIGQPHPRRVAVALRPARVARVSPVLMHVLLAF
eukprot:scaffold48914_cov58-Phaeocystis_antarctica.AAC.6